MSNDALLQRIEALELDNARLRRLLERHGSTTGLRHQVRNTLAMVRDVVRRSAERFEGAEDYAAHLDGRIDAVLRIQNTIANRLLDGVSLHLIVTDELLTHAVADDERLSVAGPDVLLQPAVASMLALAIHELATNAIKFGALSDPGGRLAVEWTTPTGEDGQTWLVLHWSESGVAGLPRTLPHRGFGAEIIEQALRYQMGGEGEMALAPDGLRCTIRLPLGGWVGNTEEVAREGAA